MDRLKDIDVVLDKIINEHDNLDELGTNELRDILKELKGLGTQIASAYTNPIPGVKVIVEDGKTDKYQIEGNVTFDLNELIAISEYGKELAPKLGDFEDKLNSRLAARKALYEQKYDRRRALENEINLRNESIAFFKKEIGDIKSVLGNPNSGLDDVKTFYYEQSLRNAENSLKVYETELGFYENEIKEVKNEMEILVYGGILPERLMDDELDSNETLDETKAVENNDELEDNVAAILTNENEEDKNESDVNALLAEVRGMVDEELAKLEPNEVEKDKDALIVGLPPMLEEENIETDNNIENSEEKNEDDTLVGVLPGTLGVEDELDLPAELDADADGNSSEVVEEEEDKDKGVVVPLIEPDEVQEVVEVVQPKPSIWKKIANVIGMAVAALSALGTAHHSGKLLNSVNKIANVLESNDTLKNEDDLVEDENKEDKEDDVNKEEVKDDTQSVPSQPSNPAPSQPSNPAPSQPSNPAPSQPSNPTPSQPSNPTPSQPSNPTPSQPSNPEENKDDVILGSGVDENGNIVKETVYDESTGVEVSASGNAAQYKEDGTVVQQEDRELEHVEEGAVVTDEDLKADEVTNTTLPPLGNEVDYDIAVQDKTADEIEEMDQAVVDFDWNSYFDDTYGQDNQLGL